MLHDTIPVLEAGKIPTNRRLWSYRIYNTINSNDFYVTNSECTKKDVLKYFNIREENIKTTLLGVDDYFKPTKEPNKEKYIFSYTYKFDKSIMLNTNSLILMFLFSCLLYYLINNHHLHIKLPLLLFEILDYGIKTGATGTNRNRDFRHV